MTTRPSISAIGPALVVLIGCTTGAPPTPPTTTQPTTQPTTVELISPGPVPSLSMDELRTEIVALAGRDLRSIGEGADGLVVTLAGHAEPLAREIHARYGGSIEIGVGFFPYPPPEASERACRAPSDLAAAPPGIVATIEMANRVVVRGQNFEATVRFTNRRAVPFDLETSSNFTLYLFRPNDGLPIGAPDGGSVGTGWSVTLPPSGSETFKGFGGTTSCEIAVGYVVPAGTYEARALVDYSDTTDPNRPLRYFWSEPVVIDVAAE